MAVKDYYQILGLEKNATADQIKQAYRNLAMQCHPDHNPGKEEWANENFKEINEAFSVLGDPQKRKQYDQTGVIGDIGNLFNSQTTYTTFEAAMKDFGGAGLRFDFLDDVFADLLKGTRFSFRIFSRGSGKKER